MPMQKTQLDDKINNCFSLIRLVAALRVFIGHALTHLQVDIPRVVVNILSLIPGVPIFFILSGFLLWNSLKRSDHLKSYVQKRTFRLFPELWCGVLLNAILILILYGHNVKWIPFVCFQFTQATFMQFWTPDSLHGYGCGCPNGSLWTIGVMLQCYLVLWVIHRLFKRVGKENPPKKQRIMLIVVLVVAISISTLSPFVESILQGNIQKLFGQTFIPYIWLFLVGAVLCEFFDYIIDFLKRFWFVFCVAMFAVIAMKCDIGYKYGTFASLLLGPAMVGFAYRFPRLSLRYDISYGLYIYHMIVINGMIELGFVGRGQHVAIALALSILSAVLSYIMINRLKRKHSTTTMVI